MAVSYHCKLLIRLAGGSNNLNIMTVIYAKALCWIIVQTKSVKTVIYDGKLIIRLAAGTLII
jgi:hypothetical protein